MTCPFCGNDKPELVDMSHDDHWFMVFCRPCGGGVGSEESYAEAVSQWNKRPEEKLLLESVDASIKDRKYLEQQITALQGELEKAHNKVSLLTLEKHNFIHDHADLIHDYEDVKSQLTQCQQERDEAIIGQAKFHEQGMHCNELQSQLLDAQAQGAQMRRVIEIHKRVHARCKAEGKEVSDHFEKMADEALQTDCGKAMLEEIERLKRERDEANKEIEVVQELLTGEGWEVLKTLRSLNEKALVQILKNYDLMEENAQMRERIKDSLAWLRAQANAEHKLRPGEIANKSFVEAHNALLSIFEAHTRDGIQSPEVLPPTQTQSQAREKGERV